MPMAKDERIDPTWPVDDDGHAVSEFTADLQGGLSPFGTPMDFPLPVDGVLYEHPGPDERPRLAGEVSV